MTAPRGACKPRLRPLAPRSLTATLPPLEARGGEHANGLSPHSYNCVVCSSFARSLRVSVPGVLPQNFRLAGGKSRLCGLCVVDRTFAPLPIRSSPGRRPPLTSRSGGTILYPHVAVYTYLNRSPAPTIPLRLTLLGGWCRWSGGNRTGGQGDVRPSSLT